MAPAVPTFRLSSFGGYAGLAGDKQVHGTSPVTLFSAVCLATLLFFGASLAPGSSGVGAALTSAVVTAGGRKALPHVAFTPAVTHADGLQYLEGAWVAADAAAGAAAPGSSSGKQAGDAAARQEAVEEVEGEQRAAREQRQEQQRQAEGEGGGGAKQAASSSGSGDSGKDAAKQGGKQQRQQQQAAGSDQQQGKQQQGPGQQKQGQAPKPQRTQPKGGQRVQLEIFGTSLSPDTGRCQLALLRPLERLQSLVDVNMRCAARARMAHGHACGACGGGAWCKRMRHACSGQAQRVRASTTSLMPPSGRLMLAPNRHTRPRQVRPGAEG